VDPHSLRENPPGATLQAEAGRSQSRCERDSEEEEVQMQRTARCAGGPARAAAPPPPLAPPLSPPPSISRGRPLPRWPPASAQNSTSTQPARYGAAGQHRWRAREGSIRRVATDGLPVRGSTALVYALNTRCCERAMCLSPASRPSVRQSVRSCRGIRGRTRPHR
jgi:hypothetical protein